MYAVIKISGNQYRVNEGDKLAVNKIQGKAGDFLNFSPIIVVSEKSIKLGSALKNFYVTAKILNHHQGKKIDIYKFHAKSRYRKHLGFRPQLTMLQIEKIENGKIQVTKVTIKNKSSRVPKSIS